MYKNNKAMMCQHFSGHIIKQLYAAFQILQETGSHISNAWLRKHKKSRVDIKADRIGQLAKAISLPRSALSGSKSSDQTLLTQANILHLKKPNSTPFDDNPFLQTATFKNKLDAKTAIADYLGKPLSRLTDLQMATINTILDESLDKKTLPRYKFAIT
ncbi:MAG: hypothetical protein Q8N30_06090 [Methylococcales bacterium]|jgi:hypothetical protein|nr:hypothetical protein [Methylococcales bacterium]